jgi:hypothetical protein
MRGNTRARKHPPLLTTRGARGGKGSGVTSVYVQILPGVVEHPPALSQTKKAAIDEADHNR